MVILLFTAKICMNHVDTTLCDKVWQWLIIELVYGFLQGILVSSTNKIDHHNITKLLLKVPLNTIKHYSIADSLPRFQLKRFC